MRAGLVCLLMKLRDFSTGTIVELCQPVSALELSFEAVSRHDAFSSAIQSDAMKLGRMIQKRTTEGAKRVGGGWKTGNRGDAA